MRLLIEFSQSSAAAKQQIHFFTGGELLAGKWSQALTMKELLCREENVLLWNFCDQWLSISLIDSHWRRFERHCHHITCQRNYIHANELLCRQMCFLSLLGSVSLLKKVIIQTTPMWSLSWVWTQRKHFKAITTETWTGGAGGCSPAAHHVLPAALQLYHHQSRQECRSTNTTVRKHSSKSWSANSTSLLEYKPKSTGSEMYSE